MIYENIPVDKILLSDAREGLRALPDGSIHMVVTSPPYYRMRTYKSTIVPVWGGDVNCVHDWSVEGFQRLRSSIGKRTTDENSEDGFGIPTGSFCCKCGAWRGQLGHEPTVEMYIQHLLEIFSEVRRVLRPDGVMFLNIGDSMFGSGSEGARYGNPNFLKAFNRGGEALKNRDMCGVPWRLAFALQGFAVVPRKRIDEMLAVLRSVLGMTEIGQVHASIEPLLSILHMWELLAILDAMWLRQDIIWHKTNTKPESGESRCTQSHEYVFLLTKAENYYFDYYAIREPATSYKELDDYNEWEPKRGLVKGEAQINGREQFHSGNIRTRPYRRKRSVWSLNTCGFEGVHFATFPPELAKIAILAGTSEKVCSECGVPYKRIVDKEYKGGIDEEIIRQMAEQGVPRSTANLYSTHTRQRPVIEATLGWEPGCKCNAPATKSLVLDPFMGAGTTAVVSRKLGRYFLGFDTSQDYVNISYNRVGPLTFEELNNG